MKTFMSAVAAFMLIVIIIFLLAWGVGFIYLIKRFDDIETKINRCEEITVEEYELYKKIKAAREYYQAKIQENEDDLK